MEKDLKNEAQKMISSSTTDQKDDAAMNEGGTGSDSSTTDQKGDDVAMKKEGGDDDEKLSDSSKLPLPLDPSVNITSNKRKFEWILASGPSETETTSSKKRCGSSPPGNVNSIKLKAGQDVVDALYELSKEYDHLRFVTLIAVTGSVSEVVLLDLNGPPNTLKGVFEIISLSVSFPADEDGRHCREKANCSMSLTDDKGKPIESTSVGCLIAAGLLVITAATTTAATPLKSVQVKTLSKN